jgi:hypothetical protein
MGKDNPIGFHGHKDARESDRISKRQFAMENRKGAQD